MTYALNSRRRVGGSRFWAVAAAVLVAAIFIVANIHLVLVSFQSQPDCVLHTGSEGVATYRAATSAC